jgi:hypothetical protein
MTEATKRRRGRPPSIRVPAWDAAAELARSYTAKPKPEPPPADPNLRLIPVEGPEMDATYFGRLTTVSQRRRLIRKGKLKCVRLGKRTYISEGAIAEFLASGGSR